jgi:CRP/FNR family transcriptional regulator
MDGNVTGPVKGCPATDTIMNDQRQANKLATVPSAMHRSAVSCAHCTLRGNCLPCAVDPSVVIAFDAIVRRARPLRKGDCIFRQGSAFSALYAVGSGAVKVQSVSADGQEQITGVYLPGEIFGMDGLGSNVHPTSAVALDTACLCIIPFDRLGELSQRMPELRAHIMRLMSKALVADQQMITLLGKYPAERRVAVLLWRISQHQVRQKMSATCFHLPLSRIDIGCYLGLTVETVSRVFSRLQKMGMLKLDNREVEILNLEALHRLAAGESMPAAGSMNS